MDTAVKSSPRVTPNFARHAEAYSKPKTARVLDDAFFIALTKDFIEGTKTPANCGLTRKEVLAAIDSGRISPDVVDDFEDALFFLIMQEDLNDPENVGSVSEDEIMKALRR